MLEAGSFRALRLWSLQLRYRSQSKGVSQFPELRIPDANAHTSVFGFYLEERLARVLSVSSPAHAGDTCGGLVASEVRKVETDPHQLPWPTRMCFSCYVDIKSGQM